MPDSEPAPVAENSPPNTAERPPAGFWLRVAAKFVDGSILTALVFLFVMPVIAAYNLRERGGSNVIVLLIVLPGILDVAYMAFFTAQGRQSPGYRLAGIKALGQDGQVLDGRRSLKRAILDYLLPIAFFIDYLVVPFTHRKRAFHDMLTKAEVVRIGQPNLQGLIMIAVVLCLLIPRVHKSISSLHTHSVTTEAMENTLVIHDRLLVNELTYPFGAPEFGDIIIYKASKRALQLSSLDPQKEGVNFIKRCIGLPGDTVYITSRQVYRKARGASTFTLLHEPYVTWIPSGILWIYDKKFKGKVPILEYLQAGPSWAYDMKIIKGKVYSRDCLSPGHPGYWGYEDHVIPPEMQQKITMAKPEPIPANEYLMLGDCRNNSDYDSHSVGFVSRAAVIGRAIMTYWPLKHIRIL